MSVTDRQTHWETIYATKREDEVSWFQEWPAISVELIKSVGATLRTAVIDVGGGKSRLVDSLLRDGFRDVTVLDISAAALAAAKARLGDKAMKATWIVSDVTTWQPTRRYEIWHDRAAFHFLADPADRVAYVKRLADALAPGGYAIIGTFAIDGPEWCSGLPIVRYDAESLAGTLGAAFEWRETRRHEHRTPSGATQKFQFSVFQRR
jgi:trans-aconitate methyltransferase